MGDIYQWNIVRFCMGRMVSFGTYIYEQRLQLSPFRAGSLLGVEKTKNEHSLLFRCCSNKRENTKNVTFKCSLTENKFRSKSSIFYMCRVLFWFRCHTVVVFVLHQPTAAKETKPNTLKRVAHRSIDSAVTHTHTHAYLNQQTKYIFFHSISLFE